VSGSFQGRGSGIKKGLRSRYVPNLNNLATKRHGFFITKKSKIKAARNNDLSKTYTRTKNTYGGLRRTRGLTEEIYRPGRTQCLIPEKGRKRIIAYCADESGSDELEP